MSAAAEDISKPLHIRLQLSASDAIEKELYELEAGHLPTARSRFLSALKGVTRLGEFIVRPESMTAYATAAAAFAAFLAVKAAERQENATFTSTLYSKQVDAIAIVKTKFEQFIDVSRAVNPFARHNFQQFTTKIMPIESAYDKLYSSAYPELINSIHTVQIIFPKETRPFLENTITEASMIVETINYIQKIGMTDRIIRRFE